MDAGQDRKRDDQMARAVGFKGVMFRRAAMATPLKT